MSDSHEAKTKVFHRLMLDAKPFWLSILCVLLLEVLGTPLALLMPVPMKIAVDSVLQSAPLPSFLNVLLPSSWTHSTQALLWVAVGMQLLVALAFQMQYLISYVLQTYCGQKLTLNFRERLFRHVQMLSFMFHDTRGTAHSIYRIQYDAPAIQNIAVYGFIPLLSSGLKLIAMAVVITRINVSLALVALSVAPILYFLNRNFNKRMLPKYTDVKKTETAVLGIIQEVLTAARVVRAFGREEHEQGRFSQRSGQMIKKRVWLSYAEANFGLMVTMTTTIGTAIVLYLGVQGVLSKTMTLGELLMVIAYLNMLYTPLKSISKEVANLQSSIVSAQRAYALLDEVPDVVEKPHAKAVRRVWGDVAYSHVSFSYDGKHPILNRIDFHVPAGSSVGIFGKTGAGKTTLISLMPRFYDSSAGQIFIDGIDVKDYRLQDLRSQFSIVLQDPLLFSSSIYENIAYAKHNATKDEIIAAAQAANAHDFIMQLPEQYETLVGERGMRLSGGERQRISLARAFLKDAPILLFDEPTSSVDTQTEKLIMEAMERLMDKRTTFMIAHRLSTLEKCDFLFEICNGMLVQRNEVLVHV